MGPLVKGAEVLSPLTEAPRLYPNPLAKAVISKRLRFASPGAVGMGLETYIRM
jgi:hypothetical protein